MANSVEKVKKYAKRKQLRLLPYLVNKTTRFLDEEEKLNPALAQALDRELHDHRVIKCTGEKPCESQSQHTLLGHLSHSGDPLQLANEYSHEERMVSL